jgi:RNA polymerase sigma-70 factor, ECF subfamily
MPCRQNASVDAAAAPTPERPDLTQLVTQLCPALLAWTQLRLPVSLRAIVAVEDLVQEVWLRVVRIYQHSFRPGGGSPRAWVFAVAKLVLLEVERAAYERAQHGAAPGGTTWQRAIAEIPEQVTSLTQRLARDEHIQRFVARVQELDEDDRQLLVFCGIEDMTQVEAAQRLGLSADAAQKRWQRLRGRVRSWGVVQDLMVG